MSAGQGTLKHEVVVKDGENQLHVYLPKDVAPSAVPTYDEHSQKTGRVFIYFDTPDGEHVGTTEVEGFILPNPIQAKFNRKQGRYTFNLLPALKSVKVVESSDEDRDSTAPQDVDQEDEQYSDASSNGADEPQQANRSADQPTLDALCEQASAAANGNGSYSDEQLSDTEDQQQQQDAVSIHQPAAGKGPAAASKAAAAAANGVDEDTDREEDQDEGDGDEQGTTAAGADGEVKKAKKRRGKKKKKKKKGTAAAADADAEQDGSSAASAADGSATTTAAAAGAADGAQSLKDDEDTDVFFDAPESISDIDESSRSSTPVGERPAATAAAAGPAAQSGRPAEIDAAAGPAVPDVFNCENYMEFFTEESEAGTTHLPSQLDEPHQPTSLLQGPAVAACLDRHEHKGEDKALKAMGATWTPAGSDVATPFSAFGVFDGHGGKSAATFASKELLPTVTKLLDRSKTAGPPAPASATPSRQHSSVLSPKASTNGTAHEADDAETWGVEVSEEDRAVWAAQEAMAERLPMAMFAGFLEADKICRGRFKVSGTTATLAVVVGWEVFVANVGDSAAYLDTGKQVVCLTGNHRVDDNPAERERVIASGGTIERSKDPDTKDYIGPNRVWPGGLNMCRTIGDPQAEQVIAVPEIRHVTLPTTGGRIIIASDGVWDHMQPKSMIHQVRNDNTEAACKKISAAAIKKKGLRDDISVLVIDLVPQSGDARPPALLPGPVREAVESCQVLRPLLEASLADGSSTGDTPRGGSASAARSPSGPLSVTTSASSSSDRHWREASAARHTAALRLLRNQARAVAEQQAAEEARAAEREAAIAAAAAENAESETYKQLKNLKLDAEELAQQMMRERQERLAKEAAARAAAAAAAAEAAAAGDADGWTTVKGSSTRAAAEQESYVPIEQQLRAHAHQYQDSAAAAPEAAAGHARGRGRGRVRGRGGRDRHEHQQQHADGSLDQQQHAPADGFTQQPHQGEGEGGNHQHHGEGFRGGRGGRFGGRGGRFGGRGGGFVREYRPRRSEDGGQHPAPDANGHDGPHHAAAAAGEGAAHAPRGQYQQRQYQQRDQEHYEGNGQQYQQQQQYDLPYRGRGRGGRGGRGRYGDHHQYQPHPQQGSFADGFGADSFGGDFHRGPPRGHHGHYDQQQQQQQQHGAGGEEFGQDQQQQHPGRGRGGRRGRSGRGPRGEGYEGRRESADADAAATAAMHDLAPPAAHGDHPSADAGAGGGEGAAVRVVKRPRGRGRGAGGAHAGGSPRVSAGEGAGHEPSSREKRPSNLQHERHAAADDAAGGDVGVEGGPTPEGGCGGRGGRRRGRGGGRHREGSGGGAGMEGGHAAPQQQWQPVGEGGARGGGRGPRRGRGGGHGGGGRGSGGGAAPVAAAEAAQ